jgi:hypothetical protein
VEESDGEWRGRLEAESSEEGENSSYLEVAPLFTPPYSFRNFKDWHGVIGQALYGLEIGWGSGQASEDFSLYPASQPAQIGQLLLLLCSNSYLTRIKCRLHKTLAVIDCKKISEIAVQGPAIVALYYF